MFLRDYVNADKHNDMADIEVDLLKPLPWEDGRFEHILFNHCIEHLPWRKHIAVLEEVRRILEPGGTLTIGYPEWEECAKAFMENRNGERWQWWVQTLYGSQDAEGQYHLAPVTKDHLTQQLRDVGFCDFDYTLNKHDAVIKCVACDPLPWY